MKPEHKIDNYIGNILTGDGRKNVTDLFEYLLENEMQFERAARVIGQTNYTG